MKYGKLSSHKQWATYFLKKKKKKKQFHKKLSVTPPEVALQNQWEKNGQISK